MGKGVCQNCLWEMVSADPIGHYTELDEDVRLLEEMRSFHSTRMCYLMYRRIARKVGQGLVLDVGCGPGDLFMNLPSDYKDLYGIDLRKFDVYRASKWIERGNFCIADGRYIPYKSGTFDQVVCTEVLEHLPVDMGDCIIDECFRVLKPSGRALFSIPNGSGIAGRYHHEHLRQFAYKPFISLLNDKGFQVTSGEKAGLYIPIISRFLELLNGASGRSLPIVSFLDIKVPEFLSINFIIECRKPAKEEEGNVVLDS
jgi:SAM-dependent methyltransferase